MTPDPLVIFRRRDGLDLVIPFAEHPRGRWRLVTNTVGWREDVPPASSDAPWRILVAGDSHSEGACANGESWPNLLEARLRARLAPDGAVENASCGGHSVYNYLGVLESYLEAHGVPDVFVMTIHAGNDLLESLTVRHYIERRWRNPGWARYQNEVEELRESEAASFAQAFQQLLHFRHYPDDEALAIETVAVAVEDAARICEERGIRFLAAWLPTGADVEWDRHEEFARLAERGGLTSAEARPGARHFAAVVERTRGVAWLDLTPAVTGAPEGSYWRSDKHLSLEGQRRVAAAVDAWLLANGPFVSRSSAGLGPDPGAALQSGR